MPRIWFRHQIILLLGPCPNQAWIAQDPMSPCELLQDLSDPLSDSHRRSMHAAPPKSPTIIRRTLARTRVSIARSVVAGRSLGFPHQNLNFRILIPGMFTFTVGTPPERG